MSRESSIVESVVRACLLWQTFYHPDEELTLGQLVERSGLRKTTCFRLLQSLVKGGMIERVGKGAYRSRVQPLAKPTFRLGFAAQTTDSEFSRDVNDSIQRIASREHIQLIGVNNRYSAKTALHNADLLIKERVNLVFEFQTYEHVAPIISSKFLDANIPVIAIEIPHPGAVFFGADNYRAGMIGGRALGRWAKDNWNGNFDALLLLELRITGTIAGLTQVLPGAETRSVAHLDGKGDFEHSLDAVRKYLRRTPPKRTLVAAVNDPMALGALRAFEEAGRSHLCAVVGQNAIRAAREELRRPGTRFIGSVAYFPERYGEELVPLALALLQKKPVPSSVFVKHELITPKNVGLVYPVQTE